MVLRKHLDEIGKSGAKAFHHEYKNKNKLVGAQESVKKLKAAGLDVSYQITYIFQNNLLGYFNERVFIGLQYRLNLNISVYFPTCPSHTFWYRPSM